MSFYANNELYEVIVVPYDNETHINTPFGRRKQRTLPDDGGRCCEVHHMTRTADNDFTRIDVLAMSDFAGWYTKIGTIIP